MNVDDEKKTEEEQLEEISKKLGKDKVEEFKSAWCLFDSDSKGSITIEEFDKILHKLDESQTKEHREEVIKQMDKDGDGSISWLEFLKLMEEVEAATPAVAHDNPEYKEAFNMADTDGNGLIDKAELKALFSQMGETLTDDEINGMLTAADKNGDGGISYKEFVEMFTAA